MANYGNYGNIRANKILVNDIVVIDDVTIADDFSVTGDFTITGSLISDGTTDTTSGTTGAIQTDGGIGIAKALYVGTTSALVGNVTVGSASGAGADVRFYGDTATADFLWDQDGDTNGSLTLGASTKSVDLRVYGTTATTYLHWDGSVDDLLLVGTATQLAVAGTTASTTSTTGSLRTAGGLGVALDAFIGGNLGLNTSASDIHVIANTAAALEFYDATTKFLVFDTRDTVTGVSNILITGMPAVIASAATVAKNTLNIAAGTTTFSGTTQVTTPMDGLALTIAQPTLGGTAVTVDQASTVYIAAEPVAGGSVTVTAAYALEIASGTFLTAGAVVVSDTTETTSGASGAINTLGGLGVTKKVFVGTDLLMGGGDIDMSAGATGTYDLILKDSVADALSIRRASTDVIVFNTTTPSVTITPATTITGALTVSAAIICDDTTASTSGTTGSIQTDGGLGVAGAAYVNGNVSSAKQLCTSNVGAANTGVSAVEYGDGYNHVSVLTVSQVDALTLGDDENLGDGYLLYTFPAGVIIVDATYMSMAIQAASPQLLADTPKVGIGTVIATGAVANLTNPATFMDIITEQDADDCNGTAEVMALAPTAANSFVILAGADRTIHFNCANTWTNDTSADLTADIAGTVSIAWRFLA